MRFEMGKKPSILDYQIITDHREQGCFAVSELIRPFCFGLSHQFLFIAWISSNQWISHYQLLDTLGQHYMYDPSVLLFVKPNHIGTVLV